MKTLLKAYINRSQVYVCSKSYIYTNNPTDCLSIKYHRPFRLIISITLYAAYINSLYWVRPRWS